MKIRKILAVIICFCAVIALMPRFSFKTEAASIGYKDINGNEWTYSLFGTYRNSDNTYFAGKKRFYIHSGQCNTYGSSYNSDKHPVFSEQFYFGGRTSLKTDNSGKEVITTSITSDKIGDVWTMENQGTRNGNNIYSICMSDGVTYLEDNTGSTALSGADMTVTTNEDDASWWELKYHEQDSTTENKNWYSGRYYFTHDKSGSDPWFYFKNDDGTYILDLSRDDGSYFFLYVELDWFQTVFYDSDGKEYKQDARQIGEFKVPEGPTRTGYTFLGWAETEGSSTVTLKAGESYKPTASKNYYPVYSTNSYTVRFYQDSTLTGTSVDQAFTYDKSQKLTKNTFTRAGYQFENWKDNSSSKTYVDEQTVSNLTAVDKSVITLYGTWNENSYTLNFSLNYGSGSAPSKTYKYSDNVTLPDGKAITRKGFTLVGWNTQLDGKGTGYLPGATVSKITATDKAEITLYAIWQENSYTVNYSANQGSCTVSSKSAKFTESFKLPDKTTVERTGYTFDNWNTKSDGTGTKYSAGTTVSGLSEKAGDVITLYAIWNENSYTLNFSLNYGSGSAPSKTYKYSDNVTLPDGKAITRKGFTLVGWNTQLDGKGTGYLPGATVSKITATDKAEITLYAIWQENSYTVNYSANQGSCTVSSKSAKFTESFKLPDKTTVERTGYTFDNWNTKSDGTGTKYSAGTTVSGLSEKAGDVITLYAIWNENSYTVNYFANYSDSVVPSKSYNYSDSFTLPADTEVIRNGYKLIGWNTQPDGLGVGYYSGQEVSQLSSKDDDIINLYAIWEEVHIHSAGEWETVKYPTCVDAGEKVKKCTGCGTIMEKESITALGHIENKCVITNIEASCNGMGEKVWYCERCNAPIKTEAVSATGHKEGKAETKILPTCTSEGVSVIKCETCGIVIREEKIPVLGHTQGYWKTIKESTCTEKGAKQQTCSVCGELINEPVEIEASGHKEGKAETKILPTCTTDGISVIKCETCGIVLREEKIPASGHKEGKAETKILPTCTTDGISVIKCETCGIVVREEKILAYGHKEGAFITEKVPTCTEEGERVSYCEICGASVKTEAIAATGHTPGSKATCVNDQVCEVCGAVLKKSDGESHTFTEWTTCKSARFLSERQDTRKCTSCGKTEYKYVIGSAKCHRYFPHSGNGESCGICLTLYKINNFFRNLFG